MDSRTGVLYKNKAEAVAAGVPVAALVELFGAEKAVRRVSRKVRMASKTENDRRIARRRQQKASRKRNQR